MKLSQTISVFVVGVSAMTACSNAGLNPENKAPFQKLYYQEQKNEVRIMVLQKSPFAKELTSNGKLRALNKNELRFRVGGTVGAINVKNGMSVREDATLAVIDPFEYEQQLEHARIAHTKAAMELEDLMLARGLSVADSGKVPREVFERLLIRSGMSNAAKDLRIARYNLNNAVIKAPLAGKVANLTRKKFEQVNVGEVFCTIVDEAEFEVEFALMEAELAGLNLNDKVIVKPFSIDIDVQGYVSEINPVIDEHGLVLVKALVRNQTNKLMEGMNVNVSLRRDVSDQLVVPKSAIVLRQNQEVLFKYSHHKAIWVYVATPFENANSYSVTVHPEKHGSLNAGDTVIVSGNVNLAHDAAVEIIM